MTNWVDRFLFLAEHISEWSKDPNKRVGAVATDQYNRIISTGFNGFPRGIKDDDRLLNQQEKLDIIIHAEENLIINAVTSLRDSQVYITHMPCSRCASKLIQAGVDTVRVPKQSERHMHKWGLAGMKLMIEGGIKVYEYVNENDYHNDY